MGFEVKKFATDAIASMEELTTKEVRMSADGKIAAGLVYNPISVTLSLEADSPTLYYLRNIYNMERTLSTVYTIRMVVTVPSTGVIKTYNNGVMSSFKDSDLGNVLSTATATFQFESMRFTEV